MVGRRADDCARAVLSAASFHPVNDGLSTGVFIMNRKQLEHIVRASGSISGCHNVIIIGSQALLGACPNAPPELLTSMEADLYPSDDPAKAELIDGCIGELSPFHETFGYYAHGVGPETAALPAQWKERLVRVESENTGGTAAWCLSPMDLAISKLLAGRPKDIEFVRQMLHLGIVSEQAIRQLSCELTPNNATTLDIRLASILPLGTKRS